VIIELQGIGAEGKRLSGEDPAAILEIEGWAGVREAGPVRFDFVAVQTGDTLVVRGALETDIEFQCSRCGDYFSLHVRDPEFEAVRTIAPGAESQDLTEDARETILLAFPNYPVCRADCKGLCPQCGVNWNSGQCACAAEAGDPRLAVLRTLKIERGV
jgi:uncharacterized protein